MYNSILVPIDPAESDFADAALAKAVEFVKQYDAELRLVSVISPIQGFVTEALDSDYDSRIAADAREQLALIAAKLDLPEERVSVSVRSGAVYHEVLEEAQAFNADLIVIASHSPGFATYLLGSNAAKVVRHAECSVLVIRD
ncbi:universal stress protein G [Breoghania corrubedonensis]|uniref:Universal stress protein n=1 Tax=Breoghania corrubedonensis TaxID=665038 RepID=A0A2T5V4Q4_9HYPH|nr:universal stress protein [Breoghania corrubedonensis]PTW58700.1 universal stress protein G [Breoghania corrubedonensis]